MPILPPTANRKDNNCMQKLIDIFDRWRATIEMERKGQLGSRKRRTDSYLLARADSSKVMTIFLLVFLGAVIFIMLAIASGNKLETDWSGYKVAPETIINELEEPFKYIDNTLWREEINRQLDKAPVYLYTDNGIQNGIVGNFTAFANIFANGNAAAKVPFQETEIAAAEFFFSKPDARKCLLDKLDNLLKSGIVTADVLGQYSAETEFYIYHPAGSSKRLAGNFAAPSTAVELLINDMLLFSGAEGSDAENIQALAPLFMTYLGNGNIFLDENLTALEKEKIKTSVQPVYRTLEKGAVLVFAGEVLDDGLRDIYKQYAANFNSGNPDTAGDFTGFAIFAIFLVSFMTLYLYHLYPQLLKSNRSMLLLVTILTATLAINLAYLAISRNISAKVGVPADYFFSIVPVPLAAILLGVTMGLRIAMCGGFLVAVVTAQMMNMELQPALLALVTCTLASLAVRSSTNYRSLFIRSFGMFAVYWILDGDLAKMLLMPSNDPGLLKNMIIIAAASSASAAMLVLPLVFILELVFNVSTNMSLLVMCDLNNPVMRQLQLLAPGTSMHSQNVAILAETAAEIIGANPLKARVAALYHDIGKLMNPEYFTENNIETANMHTSLSPRMSSMIILNHVKDGLDLAIKFKLCRVIRDAISQHHGTDLLHFYRLAQENVNNGNIPFEKDFRYPGPLPREPEIVIVSLADACEAYCKSLQKPTSSKIEAAVTEIFRTRLENGQLNDAELTVAKLAAVKDSFIRTLITMHHSRIAYRKEEENESDLHMEKSPAAPSAERETDTSVPQGS